jgi:hypothetical protein
VVEKQEKVARERGANVCDMRKDFVYILKYRTRMPVDIRYQLNKVINTPGDISEHLLTLMFLAKECDSILECGVRTIVSSWAFVNGLVIGNTNAGKVLHCSDLLKSPSAPILEAACNENNIQHTFFVGNDLDIPMQPYDMIFIDTWHIYGHLKREFAKMHSYAKKYIVLHDTEVDKVQGESIRCGWNTAKQAAESGYPEEEIRCGLGKAVEEFIVEHPEWKIKAHYTNNNGLTVLERIVN